MSDINISLSQFTDFSLKNGAARTVKVREIKEQGEYHPAFDYWRELREGIKSFHENKLNADFLIQIIDKVNPKKKMQYTEAVKQYMNFCRKKDIEWFDPGKAFWSSGELSVRATPELGLIINGQHHLIKLYFKDKTEKMEKRSATTTLTLMASSTKSNQKENALNCVLNIKKCALYPINDDDINKDMLLALHGDAANFMSIWKNL
jgi:predicted HicB family RNase H-like nuclease